MSKVMLVEDDNNLREIYEARLAAEGYEIVSAHDGEEALALAVKELPDLIISDIMMPKISGFDMLDILRSTPETKDTKVVMMTALSQAEDKERADKLGADRYLVKSQVTLEDIIRVTKELLGDEEAAGPDTTPPAALATPTQEDTVIPVAVAPTDDVGASDTPAADEPVAPITDDTNSDDPTVATPASPVADDVDDTAAPVTDDADETTESVTPSEAEPTPAPEPKPVAPSADTAEQTAAVAEDAPDIGSTDDPEPVVSETPTNDTSTPANVEDQIKDFITTTEAVKNNANEVSQPAPTGTSPTQIAVTNGDEPTEPTPVEPQLATPSGQKKVIVPINDLSQPGPDLEALLAKEEGKPVDVTTPVPSINTVISPDGTLSYASPPPSSDTPMSATQNEAATAETTDNTPHQPGDKIDPNNIAL
jgi:CheY-like chemotaxis protein